MHVEDTCRSRAFSTFLECGQMSGVFYRSVIHGLGFFICVMLQSDWLSYSYTISHWYKSTNVLSRMTLATLIMFYPVLEYSGCRSSSKCDVFIVFPKFWKECFYVNG